MLRELITEANTLPAQRDLKSVLRRQGPHHVAPGGIAVRFPFAFPGRDANPQTPAHPPKRKLQEGLLGIPEKYATNLEKIQRKFREDQILFQKK